MMFRERKKICATGIFTLNVLVINDENLEWIDAVDFNLPAVVKGIGVDIGHKVKATITMELVEEPCIICGKPTTGDKICQNCGKVICDECAKTEQLNRYCPICQVLKQTTQPNQPSTT
ncbi:MAG: zinc finger, RING-type domain-containing protein [Candidatus Bathyarchaeia archaeon]